MARRVLGEGGEFDQLPQVGLGAACRGLGNITTALCVAGWFDEEGAAAVAVRLGFSERP